MVDSPARYLPTVHHIIHLLNRIILMRTMNITANKPLYTLRGRLLRITWLQLEGIVDAVKDRLEKFIDFGQGRLLVDFVIR